MYGYFYAENNERFLGHLQFDSARDAINWFRNKWLSWHLVDAKGNDAAAFMNSATGEIIVVKEMKPTGTRQSA